MQSEEEGSGDEMLTVTTEEYDCGGGEDSFAEPLPVPQPKQVKTNAISTPSKDPFIDSPTTQELALRKSSEGIQPYLCTMGQPCCGANWPNHL